MAVLTSHRASSTKGASLPREAGREPRRRLTMAAVCYVSLIVIVGVTFLLSRVAPTPVAASVFLLSAVAVVGILHPRVFSHIARRR